MSLQGKVVIVTGAGSGIGRGIVELLASGGALLVIAEVDGESGRLVAESITRAGGEALFVPTDVADEDSVGSMIEKVVSAYGTVDGLVNNAGRISSTELIDMSVAEWDHVLAVNLRGVFLCTRAVLPIMRKNRRGSIVNISSVHAQFGFKGYGPYDASKGGIVALTRTTALENGPYQIRANAICPGYIDTLIWDKWLASIPNPEEMDQQTKEWHPLKRRGTPLDVAKAVRFLLSEDADWITGVSLVVDGGLSIRQFGM